MSDTSDLSSEEVSFLAGEGRVAIDGSIEIAGTDVLDLPCSLDVLRGGIWKLNPILKKVVVDPVNELVDTLTSLLMRPVCAILLSLI